MKRLFLIISILFCAITIMNAQQRFVYLTTEEVQIDSILPSVGYRFNLPENYRDSVYKISLAYPEFIDMSPSDIENYNRLSGAALPEIPMPEYSIVFDRKKPIMSVSVLPLAFRDGKYKWLVSFMLKIESVAAAKAKGMNKIGSTTASIYADHSILSTGKWAKIRVKDTGVYELTESVIRQAGFTDLSKVKIYGYGGNLQPEKISSSYLKETDDLEEVDQCIVNGKHYFYAKGPVSWASASEVMRTRNYYSNYGYYLITQGDDSPSTQSEETFKKSYLNTAYELNHSLYEKDEYAWYHGGRNLYENSTIAVGSSKTFELAGSVDGDTGKLYVSLTSDQASNAQIAINDSVVGTISVKLVTYDKAGVASRTFDVKDIKSSNKITITTLSGGAIRMDYACLQYNTKRDAYTLDGNIPTVEYVHNITNQDHHADAEVDMVIIIPTSQKLLLQAQRLADYHATADGLKVKIIPADELYNEFSSGTPDGNAYRRYMKMLYDRAETEDEMPKYLLLLGDCVWDNRMLSASVCSLDCDDYLLSYESENSVNEVSCYVCDLWFGALDEGEGQSLTSKDLVDVAIGRFPVATAAEAKILVDKSLSYMQNQNAGSWENEIMFMGDDGNDNLHMKDIDYVADSVQTAHPGYLVKKVMWDAYQRVTTSTGNTYPDVSATIKQQQKQGALIMDYAGHGSALQISHEAVLYRTDFDSFTNKNLPLWVTASCDIMPFDNGEATLGESALLNSNGGTMAFFGTTRTVYASYNKKINMAFIDLVLYNENGEQYSIAEAHRLANNFLITTNADKTENKLKYTFLGDPAMKLNIPKEKVVLDEINGTPVDKENLPTLKAGSKVQIKGHIENRSDFNGVVTAVVRDAEETVQCRMNDKSETKSAFQFKNRDKILYSGSDYVKDGVFTVNFVVPMDIEYSDGTGMLNLYAVSDDKTVLAHGCSEDFIIGGTESQGNDTTGPSIYCYLNTPSFTNGDEVNTAPYFVATLTDEDGINFTGSGIGHDLMLIVDGDMAKTYNLNNNFSYDFGSCTSGSTFYSIPTLEEGQHTLLFRAWDIFNNSSTTELTFNVVQSLEPKISNVSCTDNPASTETTFIVSHDRMDGNINVVLEVMDMSGRLLWRNTGAGESGSGSYTVKWDLCQANGQGLQTGVYLYRARIASDQSEVTSKAKKLIIVR